MRNYRHCQNDSDCCSFHNTVPTKRGILWISTKVDTPEHLKEQQLAKAIKQATRLLEKQGLSASWLGLNTL